MRAVVQRVREARVTVDARIVGSIGPGLLVLCGVSPADADADRDWLSRKIVTLRIFDDDAGVMNRSITEAGGELLAVSQFTLYASTRKGARPSYSAAAPPELAAPAFAAFRARVGTRSRQTRSDWRVRRAHAGRTRQRWPVTIWLDTAARE